MKKNSLKQMLDLMGAKPEPEAGEKEAYKPSAAERLGSALLKTLGGVEGVSEDELVDALLGEWNGMEHGPKRVEKPEAANDVRGMLRGDEDGANPFGDDARMPVPMKAGAANAEPMDYSEMSAEQFARLKKLLKKAAADGKRIRL
jgi:hypothetical protein